MRYGFVSVVGEISLWWVLDGFLQVTRCCSVTGRFVCWRVASASHGYLQWKDRWFRKWKGSVVLTDAQGNLAEPNKTRGARITFTARKNHTFIVTWLTNYYIFNINLWICYHYLSVYTLLLKCTTDKADIPKQYFGQEWRQSRPRTCPPLGGAHQHGNKTTTTT